MLKYVVLKLTLNDNIQYISNEIVEPEFMSQRELVEFITPYEFQDLDKLLLAVSYMDVIHLNLIDKTWKIIPPSNKKVTMQELIQLNGMPSRYEDKIKSTSESGIFTQLGLTPSSKREIKTQFKHLRKRN